MQGAFQEIQQAKGKLAGFMSLGGKHPFIAQYLPSSQVRSGSCESSIGAKLVRPLL